MIAILLGSVLGVTAETLLAQRARWEADDRVILTSFHLVSALARDEQRLYAATERGLEVLDLFSNRWELPSTVEDGYPAHESPSALAFDPERRVLWLGTAFGTLHSYQVDFRRWEDEGLVADGPILRLGVLTDASGARLFARTPSGWTSRPLFGGRVESVPPSDVPPEIRVLEFPIEERLRRLDPALASFAGVATVDEDGRAWPITDAAEGRRPGEVWLATAGDNLIRVDARFQEAERFPFGLLTEGGSALGVSAGDLWIGGDGRGPRRGPVRTDPELRRFRTFEARPAGAVPVGPIARILVESDAVWFASADGPRRFDRGDGTWTRIPLGGGFIRVNDLARDTNGTLWAASDGGLFSFDGPEVATRLPGRPVMHVLTVGEELWAATDQGPVRFGSGGAALGWSSAPPISPLVGLAQLGADVWAAAEEGLWRHSGAGWEGPFREVSQAGLGRLRGLRSEGDWIVVWGEGGVALRRGAEEDPWSTVLIGGGLPSGPVMDAVVVDRWLFVSTPSGVMRIRLGALG